MAKVFNLTKKEVEYIHDVANLKERDNMLFFGETTDEVFLLLHGGYDKLGGYVGFNSQELTLCQVYRKLKNESVFVLLKTLDIKHIFVLCCHSFYQDSYKEDGIIIETYFNNKGLLLGEQLSSSEYKFVTEEEKRLVA